MTITAPAPLLRLLLVLCTGSGLLAAAQRPDLGEIVTTELIVLPYDIIELYDKPKVFGEVIQIQEGEQIVFRRQDSNIHITAPWKRIKALQLRQTPSEVVAERGAQIVQALEHRHLRTLAENEVVRLVRWAAEREALPAARETVLAAYESNPENPVLQEALVDLLVALGETGTLEEILRAGIERKATWRRGYEELATLLQEAGREEDLRALTTRWIENLPSSERANALMVDMAMQNGDLQAAQESYRKLYAHHGRVADGLRFVRLSLRLGDLREAMRVLPDLEEEAADLPGLPVVAASARLLAGDVESARVRLQTVTQEDLQDPELRAIHDYNTAWLAWQDGDTAAALAAWKDQPHPAAGLATALLQRRPVSDQAILAHAVLGPIARELNAALALEAEKPRRARALIGDPEDQRQLTLDRIAEIQLQNYAPAALDALRSATGRDAVLWRAYGLIKNGAFRKALQVLEPLPENDGWAAVYRLFCAEALNEGDAAAGWYEIALQAPDAPRDYLTQLTAFYYRAKNDRELHVPFDWPAGEVLAVGWQRQAVGTNITIQASGEDLHFSGLQTAAKEPISRAWRVLPKSDIRRVQARILPGDTPGAVGLELLDERRLNGLAIAVIDGGPLAWRRMRDGAWSEWMQLLEQAPGSWSIWLDDQQSGDRQIQLIGPRQPIPLTGLYDLPSAMVGIGFFVEADPGSAVDARFDDLRIQLHQPDENDAGAEGR